MEDEAILSKKKLDLFIDKKPTEATEVNESSMKVSDGDCLKLNTTDEAVNFDIVSQKIKKGGIPMPSYQKFNELTPKNKLDYEIAESKDKKELSIKEFQNRVINEEHKSFLEIKNVKDGEEWYRQNFPKVPDELYPIMARWNWGDLKSHTAVSVKQDIKKKQKKIAKQGFKVQQGNFVVKFE
tara:strand:- start:2351 stop:2896 length:546 start_codon:yes stop_codon:yes gene_type:complete